MTSNQETSEEGFSTALDQEKKSVKSNQERKTSALFDLHFSDLYVELNARSAWYKRTPDDFEGTLLDGLALEEVCQLVDHIRSSPNHTDFRVEWRGLNLRGGVLQTISDDVMVLRRVLDEPLPFASIGYPNRLRDSLSSSSFNKGGLVLFGGGTGAGNTSSMISWLLAR